MPSLLTPVNGDIVTVHVIKHLISNPGAVWSNTYDFRILDASSGTLFTGITLAVVAFETGLLQNTVHLDEVRVSTFLPDSRPYNPEAFITTPLDAVGATVPAADPCPLGYAWLIERRCPSGRVGKLFFRAALAENDVNSAGGLPTLTAPTFFSTKLATILTSSGLIDYIASVSTEAEMVVAHYNPTSHVTTARKVEAFVSKNAILAKLSHRRKRHIVLHS